MSQASHTHSIGSQFRELVIFAAIFTLLWIVLTQGDASSWLIGGVVVPVAAVCAVLLLNRTPACPGYPEPRITVSGIIRFIPFFLWQSLRGGWESAMFAILPNRQVRPGFINYRTGLPAGRPRLYLLHVVSLLPGTVSAAVDAYHLTIHALDTSADHVAALQECEARVAALFDIAVGNRGALL